MICGCARSLHAALVESDQLLARHRFGDALALATRALGLRSAASDVSARFRIVRAHSLWMYGRVAVACGEARRAVAESDEPLTRARAHDALALFAWKDAHFTDALALAERARRVYEARSSLSGIARSLQAEAGLLADRGELEPALRAQTQRVAALCRSSPERLAEALADRSTLLALLGRWDEARASLQAAARLFERDGEPGAFALKRAALELKRGEPGTARRLLEEAREAERMRPSSPRALADACLVGSDILLAGGFAEEAEAEATAAIRLFGRLADRGGECRSRVRRAQALLALGRLHESIRESRRTLVDAARAGMGIEALAELTLGRALLRARPGAAPLPFERAERAAQGRPDLTHAARLGRALACPGSDRAREIDVSLAALERWGDRRLLGLALAEVRGFGAGDAWRPHQVYVSAPPREGREAERALVEAALALQGAGEWPDRWARAMGAVGSVVSFRRASLVAESGAGLEIREGFPTSRPLGEADLARDLARRAQGPAVFDLGGHPSDAPGGGGRDLALVVPVGQGTYLCVEGGEHPSPEGALGVLTELGRLLAAHLPLDAETVVVETEAIPGLVGRSEPMRALVDRIARAALSESPIHILGETGTGKEHVARALHDLSPRAGRPFIPVNAASLGDELLESQLFGHVRGAFSGAVGDSEGYVAAAEGGTLFLDEVADLSPKGQAKLLRFLQDKQYCRLGETRLRRANVRVLTAANVPLRDRVAAGRFREDLLYRLEVFTVAVPPLRERGDDALLLARHFLKAAAERDRVPVPRLPRDVGKVLLTYRWPGNVRELESEMGRLVLLARGRVARRDDLSPEVAGGARPPAGHAIGDVRRAFERDHVTAALRRSGGIRTRAAADLGITRQALYDKMRRLGLSASFKNG